uniref:Uncharacterized protein n=1 Tax=Coccidioides posadasii RMSCC 3488 TaxID=454284 RepID=A0A0J6FLS2_COCPO|nr:hypothetical protein CPAG_07615 [Coccidioides posadasii RMSCC 3488]
MTCQHSNLLRTKKSYGQPERIKDKASTQLPQQQSGQCRLAPGSYVTVFGPDPSSGGLLPTPSRHTRSALGLTLEHPIGSESLKFGDGLIFVVGFTGANERTDRNRD